MFGVIVVRISADCSQDSNVSKGVEYWYICLWYKQYTIFFLDVGFGLVLAQLWIKFDDARVYIWLFLFSIICCELYNYHNWHQMVKQINFDGVVQSSSKHYKQLFKITQKTEKQIILLGSFSWPETSDGICVQNNNFLWLQ